MLFCHLLHLDITAYLLIARCGIGSMGVHEISELSTYCTYVHFSKLLFIIIISWAKSRYWSTRLSEQLPKPMTRKFSDDIDRVALAVHNLGLQLDASKTKLVVILRKRNPPSLNLVANSSVLRQVNSVTYLSHLHDLSWGPHIDTLCSRARKQLGVLHRHFHSANSGALLQFYKSLVLLTLDYRSSLWVPTPFILRNWSQSKLLLPELFLKTGEAHPVIYFLGSNFPACPYDGRSKRWPYVTR